MLPLPWKQVNSDKKTNKSYIKKNICQKIRVDIHSPLKLRIKVLLTPQPSRFPYLNNERRVWRDVMFIVWHDNGGWVSLGPREHRMEVLGLNQTAETLTNQDSAQKYHFLVPIFYSSLIFNMKAMNDDLLL